MKICDVDLDDFTRSEYIHFIKVLIEYFIVNFDNEIEFKDLSKKVTLNTKL